MGYGTDASDHYREQAEKYVEARREQELQSFKPSVGRIVHYISYGTPNGEHKSELRAAIITAVHSHEVVDLCVLNPTGMYFNQKVSKGTEGGMWTVPERV